jgi:hypothetical protein
MGFFKSLRSISKKAHSRSNSREAAPVHANVVAGPQREDLLALLPQLQEYIQVRSMRVPPGAPGPPCTRRPRRFAPSRRGLHSGPAPCRRVARQRQNRRADPTRHLAGRGWSWVALGRLLLGACSRTRGAVGRPQGDEDVTEALSQLLRAAEDPSMLKWLCEQPEAMTTTVEMVAIADGKVQQQQASTTDSATSHLDGLHMTTLLQGCRLLYVASQHEAKSFSQQDVNNVTEVIEGERLGWGGVGVQGGGWGG